MAVTVTKRISVNLNKDTAAAADLVIKQLGLKASDVVSMLLTQIANKGALPVALAIDDYDKLKNELVIASHAIPIQNVETAKEVAEFIKS